MPHSSAFTNEDLLCTILSTPPPNIHESIVMNKAFTLKLTHSDKNFDATPELYLLVKDR
jgi:hypothetical protein